MRTQMLPMLMLTFFSHFPSKKKGRWALLSSLLRMSDPEHTQGAILFDDTDIARVGIHDVRKAVAVIPERRALDCTHAIDLGMLVGDNVSVPTSRQLPALASALARNSRILIVTDEVPTSFGTMLQSAQQRQICDYYRSCTKILISRNLATIVRSHRVLVIRDGHVVEFDTPFALLSEPNSYFSQLVEQTGSRHAAAIRKIAAYAAQNPFDRLKLDKERSAAWEEEWTRIRHTTLSPPSDV